MRKLVERFLTWPQEDPRALALIARFLHRLFRLRQHLRGPEGFLLIFTGALGDVVSLSPALRELARRHPGAPMGIILKGRKIDILESCPYLDQVVSLPLYESTRHKWWPFLKTLGRVALRHRYTTAILAMGTGWRFEYRIWGLLLLYATGARSRLVMQDEYGPWRKAAEPIHNLPLANQIIPVSQIHRTDRFLEFFEKAGLIDETRQTATEVWTSDHDLREMARLDESFGRPDEKRPLVLVFPSIGSGLGKQWPVGRYVKLINALPAICPVRVFLDGTSADYLLCRAIAAFASCGNLAGRHSIGALCALIARADLVLGSDSGPIHIAGATGTPTVALYGPTDPAMWAPRSSCITIIRKSECNPCGDPYDCHRELDFPCIKEVQVSDVVQACRRILLGPQRSAGSRNPRVPPSTL